MKSIQPPYTINTKTFDTSASINLRPPPIDRHKSFDEDDFSKKPVVVKKTVTAPTNVTSYSIADLQVATGSFSVENLLGEGSFGRVYRAQFSDGKVNFLPNKSIGYVILKRSNFIMIQCYAPFYWFLSSKIIISLSIDVE